MQLSATLGIIQTFGICVILSCGAYFFSKITTELVIEPIENMIERVKHITSDPLSAIHEEEERLLIDAMKWGKKNQAEDPDLSSDEEEQLRKEKEKNQLMETELLEQTLYKIGALMAIGYGEAGSRLIAQNMAQSGDSNSELNPMLPGEKIISIFGFCDIRKFTNATEILREGVMLFVNEIGQICHGIVDRYSGAANKNVGDAFLFVWKLDKEDMF